MKHGLLVIALVLLASACEDGERPVAVLTSEHFRLHVYAGAMPAPDVFERLEADYYAAHAFLKFPERRIEYHLFGSEESSAKRCWPDDKTAPTRCASGAQVFTTSSIDHHELVHAYMAGVGSPPPILQEGIADGVLCGLAHALDGALPPWPMLVTKKALEDKRVYAGGLALFVSLLKKFGVDRFVEYYGVASDTADPAVFQAEFESYWGLSLDTVWQEMQRPRLGYGSIRSICPCTHRQTLPLDGSALDLRAVHATAVPFPDGEPGPYVFSADVDAQLLNCAQDYLSFSLANLPAMPTGIAAALLLPERHYFSVDPRGSLVARKGSFVARSCEETEPVSIPQGYAGPVSMVVARRAEDPSPADWTARFRLADGIRAIHVQAPLISSERLRICPSCGTALEACVDVPPHDPGVTLETAGPDVVLRATYALLPEAFATSTFTVMPLASGP